MDEKKVIVFSVYQYACGDIEANKKFEDLIRYMMSNHIILESGQMIISGRVCKDLKIGDVLVTQKGTLINVKGFHAYGAEFDFMPAGMVCVFFTDSISEGLTENQSLYFAENSDYLQ